MSLTILATASCVLVGQQNLGPIYEPPVTNNITPELYFKRPVQDSVIRSGADVLSVQWEDSDIDSNSDVSFYLVRADNETSRIAIGAAKENDTGIDSGPESLEIQTLQIAPGDYYLLGIIDDQLNPAVEVYATRDQAVENEVVDTTDRIVITIVGTEE